MTEWSKLTEPFPAKDIEWRIQQSGVGNKGPWARVLAYITARAIQERLDTVFGPGGWKNEYKQGPDGGVLCRIYFRDDQGEWVWREDAAENTDIEGVKGGISGSLKRAGAALGIGRYLYNLEAGFADITENGQNYAKTKDGTFKWNPPGLPDWALPEGDRISFATQPLDYIKKYGRLVADNFHTTFNGENVNLKDYVRENWQKISEDGVLAVAVAATIADVLSLKS